MSIDESMKELKCIVYSNNPKIENWQFNMEKYRLVHSSFPVEPKVFLFGRDHVDPIFIYRAIWENRIIEDTSGKEIRLERIYHLIQETTMETLIGEYRTALDKLESSYTNQSTRSQLEKYDRLIADFLDVSNWLREIFP